MPDAIGRNSANPFETAHLDQCSEPTPAHATSRTTNDVQMCQESPDPAVAQLTSKYRPNVNAFLAAQEPAGASAPRVADPAPADKTIEYAQLAQAAYDSNASPPGWHRLEAAELEAAGLDPSAFGTPETGFKAALFRNEESGEFVLAFAGTEDGRDWLTNGNQGLGNVDTQYRQAANLSVAVTDAVGSTTMVGHSLGGGLAATASVASRNEGVTFNAAGVHANTLEFATTAQEPAPRHPLVHPAAQLVIDRFEEQHAHATTDLHVTNYRLQGDPLTALQELTPIPEAQGRQVDVAPVSDYNRFSPNDALQLHLAVPEIDALRGREYESRP